MPRLINSDWVGYDLNWWYAAPVTGLGFNDNSIDITWKPGAIGRRTRDCSPWNPTSGMSPSRTAPAPPRPAGRVMWATGCSASPAPCTCGLRAMSRPMRAAHSSRSPCPTPTSSPHARSGRHWQKQESQSPGPPAAPPTRLRTGPPVATTPLAESTSRPLKDWIFPILNTSQNWYAEMLLKQLGKQFEGKAGSGGIAAERRFLHDSVGVDTTLFALSDGSGPRRIEPGEPARLHPAAAIHPHSSALSALSPPACRSRDSPAR